MRTIQRALHRQLREESIATRQRIADVVRPLDSALLVQHPATGGWSVGDVLEHLCTTEDAYGGTVKQAMASARADAGAADRQWKSTLLGRLIANSLLNARPLKAPRLFKPGPTPRGGVLEAFLAQEMALVQRMGDADALDWNRVRIGSPALPSFAPRLNLGDVFRVHVVHVTRHAKQIERVVYMLA